MLRNLFGKLIFERRRSMVWWALGVTAMVFIIVAFYPTIRDNDEMLKLIESMPKELLAVGGITDAAGELTKVCTS